MADEQNIDLDLIWKGDLFDRRTEAAQLQAYIEALAGRPALREDKHAFTIAVDAGYGEGKTFFLRRMAKQLELNHPVAFIDAWADDLADEPLTALAATLKQALAPFVKEPHVRSSMSTFMEKTGKVAKIASIGLVRRGLGLALTGVAVDGMEEVLSRTGDAVRDAVEGGVAEAAEGAIADSVDAIRNVTSHALMEQRVAEFEEGRAAVQAMKDSLSAVVNSLNGTNGHGPIVIIIDELDRCRPSYAVKLLEEIKHLFDVAGVVFVLGMHGRQLGHSVSGAYGYNFDGRAYLRRFIDRELTLATPSLHRIVKHLVGNSEIKEKGVHFRTVRRIGKGDGEVDVFSIIAEYLRIYGLAPRDAFNLVHIMETSLAIAGNNVLHGVYVVPLAIGHIIGLARGELPVVVHAPEMRYVWTTDYHQQEIVELTFEEAAIDFQRAAALDLKAAHNEYNNSESWGVATVRSTRSWNTDVLPITDIARYPDLIATVGRFRNPSLEASSGALETRGYN